MSKTIFFSVGEPSGDQHAARLVRELLAQNREWKLRGFGGKHMQQAGCQIDLDLTEHAVVGILEVLPKIKQFFGFADQAEALFAAGEVDAVVLVDFPGFNWHIAKRAKRYGIPVFYYCPPQLWAWAAWRIKKMKRTVDHVLCVLPVEQAFFSQHGMSTELVGHPFFDAVAESTLDADRLQQLCRANESESTVAVLPGSRTHEVHRNWPIMVEAIKRLAEKHPDVRFAVAAYREKHLEFCKSHPEASKLPVDFYLGCTSEIIEHSKCAMMVSGSVSLELMARQTPAVVLYRIGRFLNLFAKLVVRAKSMTLPNMMPIEDAPLDQQQDTELPPPEDRVFPEIVSVGNPTPAVEFLTESIDRMLSDSEYFTAKQSQLTKLGQRYAEPGATFRAAQALDRRIPRNDQSSTQRAA